MSARPHCSTPSVARKRSARSAIRRTATTLLLLAAGLGANATAAGAAVTPMVDLGQASTYAVLSGASVGNTVSAAGAPHTTLRGDLGVEGEHAADRLSRRASSPARSHVGNAAAAQAHADLVAAYTEVAARTGGAPLAGALAGATLTPGLHTIAGAASNTGTVTLDGGGDPNAVFVFQVNGALAMAAGSHVVLTNGARASRVFWQVNGAGADRRQRRVRRNADGARRGRDGQRDRWSTAARSPATAPSRSTPTSSTAPRPWSRSPVGPPRSRPTRPRRSAARPTSRRRASSP